MMNLKAYTMSNCSLIDAKRIYLNQNIEVHTTCPKCNENIVYDKRVPFLTNSFDGTFYTHHLYCDHCSYESKEKMVELISINEDSINVEFNPIFKIDVYEKVLQKKNK